MHCLRCNLEAKKEEDGVLETEMLGSAVEILEKEAEKGLENGRMLAAGRNLKIGDARRRNTCRGYYEGKYDEICKMYRTCDACWTDFEG